MEVMLVYHQYIRVNANQSLTTEIVKKE